MESNCEIITVPIPGVALQPLELAVAAVTPEMLNDDVLALYDRVAFVARESKRLKDLMEKAMVDWMTTNHLNLEVSPTVHYYVGTSKSTKCTDVPATVEALLAVVDGDFKRFCDTLAANAIKHGAAKKLLAMEVYRELFKVTEKSTLEGGPEKELMKADATFM